MNFWFDIVNSPHVLFFKPIIDELTKRGHAISITARTYGQTTGLLNDFRLPFTLIGSHAGSKISKKMVDVITRGIKLCSYARNKKFDLALTFNSPSLVFAAKILRIPSMVFMDYEYQPLNHLTFRLANRVVTPALFPDSYLAQFGACKKTVKYNGLKEQVYLSDFKADPKFLDSLGIAKNRIVITARPPATMALYHRFENDLFYELINYLLKSKEAIVIAIPRSSAQKSILRALQQPNLVIPDRVVDGRELLYRSDLVISAGGTMNREAAVLGIPAYTVFKGKIGAVDKYLIGQGMIIPISSKDDFNKIRIIKKRKKPSLLRPELKEELLNLILSYRNLNKFLGDKIM